MSAHLGMFLLHGELLEDKLLDPRRVLLRKLSLERLPTLHPRGRPASLQPLGPAERLLNRLDAQGSLDVLARRVGIVFELEQLEHLGRVAKIANEDPGALTAGVADVARRDCREKRKVSGKSGANAAKAISRGVEATT